MSEPSGHIANEGEWIAVCVAPDYCKVGPSIVPFDSFAIIDSQTLASPDVEVLGVAVFRVGDLHCGVLADAGEGVPSGTSLGGGHVKFLTGQNSVEINGLPAVRHDSLCLVNCNAAGIGGAIGRLLTELAFPTPAPATPSPELQALLDEAADDRGWLEKAGDLASGAWEGTKRVGSAVLDDPGDAAIGLGKGVLNLPTDLWNLGVLGYKHTGGPLSPAARADMANKAAVEAYNAGDVARANELAAQGHDLTTSGYADDLFEIKNDAQAGGSFLSMFVPLGAIVKGAGTAGKLGRGAKAVDAAADAARATDAADNITDLTRALKAADEAQDALKAADGVGDAAKGGPGIHIGPGKNHLKAAFAEDIAHTKVTSGGAQPLGKTNGIYKPGATGIDGVYKYPGNPPRYLITEVKYGTAKLNKKVLSDGTVQMQDNWVKNRLHGARVNFKDINAIEHGLDAGTVEKVLIHVAEDGTTTARKIDKDGVLIPGDAGKVPGF